MVKLPNLLSKKNTEFVGKLKAERRMKWEKERLLSHEERIVKVGKKEGVEKEARLEKTLASIALRKEHKCRSQSSEATKQNRLERYRKWAAKNPDKVRAYRKRWLEAHPGYFRSRYDKRRDGTIRSTYGIGFEDVQRMKIEQGNKCKICSGRLKPGRGMNIDHCHETGKVRGLLCPSCNKGLGDFRDSALSLKRARAYLEKNGNVAFGPRLVIGACDKKAGGK